MWKDLGLLGIWYLRQSQLDLYELLHLVKDPFLECARRFGKTTTVLCYVFEKLRQNQNWTARWCEPWKNQCREIVMPEVDKIQAKFPHDLRFHWVSTDSHYIHPGSGSRLYLRGVNDDRGESARGPTSNIIIADEFGSWNTPEYTVNEVLRPQLLTTNGQFIFMSSPAADLAHPYYEHMEKAIAEKRFIQKTIYQNETLTEEKIQEIIKEVGGPHTAAWRREYLCQPVSDPERLVIPEYKAEIHDIEDDEVRPQFCTKFVGADFGWNDHTALLFAYWDFERRKLVIEDEHLVAGENSENIAKVAKSKEIELWGGELPAVRTADANKQQIYDLMTMCNYPVTPAVKDDKFAAINALRLRFGAGEILIKKRCERLRYQLKVGLWNERRTDFQRGERTGHLDAVAALVYLNRTVRLHEHLNPIPANLGVSQYTHWVDSSAMSTGDGHALKKAFRPYSKGNG